MICDQSFDPIQNHDCDYAIQHDVLLCFRYTLHGLHPAEPRPPNPTATHDTALLEQRHSFIHPYTQTQLSPAAARAMEPEPDRGVSLLCPAPNPSHQPSLRAAKSTAFKREERRKHKEQKRERKRQESLALALEQWEPLGAPPRPAATSPPGAPPDDKPWPCDPPSPADAAPSSAWGWGPPAEPSADRSWSPPAEPPTQPPVAARCPQAAAVRACRALFEEHADNDDDDAAGDEEGEEEEGGVARFFDELLEKDAGLRGFYEAERETGRFLCLVCEGIGARAGKRFPGCAALVQHASSVARTKRRLAHRAFADALGRLLGWGAGRTTPFPADCDNDSAIDQAEHLDASECAEMEVT